VRSSLSLPLKTGDLVLGALNVYSDHPRAFNVESALSLGAFAAQATTSLFLLGQLQAQREDTAYVTSFSHRVQESLRTVLPDVPDLEMVGASVPSAPNAEVGGDWYDALVLPDGTVGLVIGDVMGHDIGAVTAMAQLRTMVRTGAWLGNSPVEILRAVDQLAELSGITETATLFYGKLSRNGSHAQLHYSNAGHLRPMLRDPTGTVSILAGGSRVLLGALGTANATDPLAGAVGEAELPPGALLLLYTDGLVERSGTTVDEATEVISSILAGFGADAPLTELCQQLLASPNATDDTTVFAIRNTAI
jgi:serine phosphatase RsbU (regulator of sigma subunit)